MSEKAFKKKRIVPAGEISRSSPGAYGRLVSEISTLLEQALRGAARSVNAILTSTYWEVGRRIVEHEQGGQSRAEYGEELLVRLGNDLTKQHGRGFSWRNLYQMRSFYEGWKILQTPSAKFEVRATFPGASGDSGTEKFQTPSGQSKILQTLSAKSGLTSLAGVFPLSWSHYVRLMSVDKPHARAFYESEAIRGGWSVRQLDRQISTQFFERTAHSKNPAALLGQKPRTEDKVSLEHELRDPYLLEFLNLKDEYSESEPVSQLRARAHDGGRRERACRPHPVQREKRCRGPLRDGRDKSEGFRVSLPDGIARP